MKIRVVAAVTLGMVMSTTLVAMNATNSATLNTDVDKISYSIGADLGMNFKKQGIDINAAAMSKGLQDALSGNQLSLTQEQMKEVLTAFQKDLMAKRSTELTKKAEENKAKGEQFLAQNKNQPGVTTLPSGLQYKILEAGNGPKPAKDATVTVEYTGRLINGQVFDSADKTKPATFKISQVILGWTEALQLMPTGSTWEVYIPANLAYGPRNMGGVIGPNETLIFKIHLLSTQNA